jgi:hypothetical protein
MICKLLYLPIYVWLLLPPGLCLTTLNQIWGLSPFADPTIPAFADGDEDHSPSCPCKKSAFTARGSADAPAYATLPPEASILASADPQAPSPGRIEAAVTAWFPAGTTDRYLALRTLLI